MCQTKSNLLHGGQAKIFYLQKLTLVTEESLMSWDCDKASEIWKLSGIPSDTQGAHFEDFKDLLWHVMFIQHFSDKLVCLFITIAWGMWFNRN